MIEREQIFEDLDRAQRLSDDLPKNRALYPALDYLFEDAIVKNSRVVDILNAAILDDFADANFAVISEATDALTRLTNAMKAQ